MIILIRGTNGAGKTYAVRQVISTALVRERATFDRQHGSTINKIPGVKKRVLVVGAYPEGLSMGGSDKIRHHRDIYALINKGIERGYHVIIENVQIAARPFYQFQSWGNDVRLVLIDPPLHTCRANVLNRQKERGRIVALSKTAHIAKHKKAWSMFRDATNNKKVTETYWVRGGEEAARRILEILRST